MKKESMGMMIAQKRRELGMTQLELAEKMGVTDKAVKLILDRNFILQLSTQYLYLFMLLTYKS